MGLENGEYNSRKNRKRLRNPGALFIFDEITVGISCAKFCVDFKLLFLPFTFRVL